MKISRLHFPRFLAIALLFFSACGLRAEAVVEHFTVHSASMGREIKAWAVLPPAYAAGGDARFPVLYALHGRGAPYDTFAKMPKLQKALTDQPMIVVGFDADNSSFYLDSGIPQNTARDGEPETVAPSKFSTFFFDEFVPALDTRYRIAADQRAITGFSMGGFGAFHYMLQRPDMFRSVSAMSGAFFETTPPSAKWVERLTPLFGSPETASAAYEKLAFFPRLERLAKDGVKLPPIYLSCGTEDKVTPDDSRHLHAYLDRLGVPNEYVESAGGHDWGYWSSTIVPILDFHWKSMQTNQTKNDAVVFPAKDWTRPPADARVIAPADVDHAVAALKAVVGKDGVSGVMVIQNGYLLWAGDRIDEKRPVWSCTKSFLSTCLGLLWDDGKLTPDDLASKYLPELAKDYPTVTLRHLATFTSGVHVEDGKLEAGAPDYAPGAAMHYSAQSDLLGRILTRVAGEPLADLFKRRVADPIGMDPAGWEWKHAGSPDGIVVNGGAGYPDSGMHMTARNLARFGWLYANGGVWDGRRLISERYIALATTPKVSADTPMHDPKGWYYQLPGRYGLNWWTNGIGHDGVRLWPHAPASTFAAQGNKNNICIILPEWKLVLVRTGLDQIIDVQRYDDALKILGEGLPSTR
jgi:CubicO group peptidase (beta-lactamase class C family)/S-formylglutathione hydrolase FrmB